MTYIQGGGLGVGGGSNQRPFLLVILQQPGIPVHGRVDIISIFHTVDEPIMQFRDSSNNQNCFTLDN